jgi:hypothetical protein
MPALFKEELEVYRMRRRQLQQRIAALEKRLTLLEAKVFEPNEGEQSTPEPLAPKAPEVAADPFAPLKRKISFDD